MNLLRHTSNKITAVGFVAAMVALAVCCSIGYTGAWPSRDGSIRLVATYMTYFSVQIIGYAFVFLVRPCWLRWRASRRLPVARAMMAPRYTVPQRRAPRVLFENGYNCPGCNVEPNAYHEPDCEWDTTNTNEVTYELRSGTTPNR